ncbi:MAG: septal ring lytic transglycosylase RlpA family protein [Hyphomicrobiaceae bacterium]
MRFILSAATVAAITLVACVSTASADDWADNTSYRNFRSTDSTSHVRRGLTRQSYDSDRQVSRRRARVSRSNDEDRPQRHSRSRHTRSASNGRVSIGGSSGGGSVGVASYYWQPQRVASGGWFNPNAMTAAHKSLPFGTRVRVTHLGNGRSVTVTINDRGPYIAGRIIDLSRAAASAISMTGQGVARIRMTVLGR